MSNSVFLVGAGNVGYHLGRRFKESEIEVKGVFSRSAEKADELGRLLGVPACSELDAVDRNADLYILAVSDSAIGPVASELSKTGIEKQLVVHTSGATPSTVLQPFFRRYGVFYPLQTFSRDREVDFSKVPVCVQASTVADEELLFELGHQISQAVYRIDDEQRAVLHVAAVFANNFANHLFQIAFELLRDRSLSFDLLRPLIEETAAKVQGHSPEAMQTGPAIRGDEATIGRHLELLKTNEAYRQIYELLTESIAAGRKK